MKIKDVSSHQVDSYRIGLSCDNRIDEALKRFWGFEEVPSLTSLLSEEDVCEVRFQKTYNVDENGRFVVKLSIFDKKETSNSSRFTIFVNGEKIS
ncbi:hypothetical protein NPIL_493401 [Nephila pilipes]|uniref:Uncharacterized protein n=1 Tax=Nephila pilipes TaxID=299642 RepID=A0A8X6URH3_NEPPI|nr:hypothetical protein NPIL_493401 [Nephila pilipes]